MTLSYVETKRPSGFGQDDVSRVIDRQYIIGHFCVEAHICAGISKWSIALNLHFHPPLFELMNFHVFTLKQLI